MKPQKPVVRSATPAPVVWAEPGEAPYELIIERDNGVFYAEVNGKPLARSADLARLLRAIADAVE